MEYSRLFFEIFFLKRRVSALKLAAELQESYGLSVNLETVRTIICSKGFHGWVERNKTILG